MKRQILGYLPILAMMLSPWATGYEITTHALITDHAYLDSVLNPENSNSVIPALGFDRLDLNYPFGFNSASEGAAYRDEVALANPASTLPGLNTPFIRSTQAQEGQIFDALVSNGYLSGSSGEAIEQRVQSWLMRGAIREDDNDFILLGSWHDNDHRDLDPFGRILRATKHFYDPLYDRAFDYPDYCSIYTCKRSTLWALGRTNPLNPTLDAEDTARRNHFTWQDARNNYWWALVVKRDSQNDGYDFSDSISDGYERITRWATAINDLGHVIHLLQDTAQPQHVRNDAHGPPLAASWPESETDAAFEAFTDYRVLRNRDAALAFTTTGGNPLRRMKDDTLPVENNLPAIQLGQSNYYPGAGGHVQFDTPVKFFTTRHIETSPDDGTLRTRRGLADMSNRSFFTAGTLPGFRECQPPGTSGCIPTPGYTYTLPPNDLTASGYTEVSVPIGLRVHSRVVQVAEYAYPITDAVVPNYDQSINSLAAYGGKAPLVTKGIWHDIIPDDLQPQYLETTGYLITYNNMRYMADVMVPRAVGYSAGMIDFFFRGRLEVTPIDQSIFAVLNQGDPHTVDAFGYPRKVSDPTKIFGFESVRLRVRNTTPSITESGTGAVVPQTTGGTGSRLIAIARYNRNACYKPDMSGERVRSYDGTITEPVCSETLPVRTKYEEISVSAPLSLTVGELDTATPIEKFFDFSNDPIPVNATDLFIQVAYRGPLGEEPDGIAIGNYDVSEPTFAAAWNNTDYFWNNSAWISQNTTYPRRGIYSYWVCAGVPSKFMYRYQGTPGNFAMTIPPDPGAVRLAFLFGKPASANQRFPVRSVPIMQTAPHASTRSPLTRGQIRQANRKFVDPSALEAPYAGCFLSPPPLAEYWCFDPILKRRGIAFGEMAQPLYYGVPPFNDGADVDSVPLPVWSAIQLRSGGEIRFNEPGNLLNCPSQPNATEAEIEYQDLLEQAEFFR